MNNLKSVFSFLFLTLFLVSTTYADSLSTIVAEHPEIETDLKNDAELQDLNCSYDDFNIQENMMSENVKETQVEVKNETICKPQHKHLVAIGLILGGLPRTKIFYQGIGLRYINENHKNFKFHVDADMITNQFENSRKFFIEFQTSFNYHLPKTPLFVGVRAGGLLLKNQDISGKGQGLLPLVGGIFGLQKTWPKQHLSLELSAYYDLIINFHKTLSTVGTKASLYFIIPSKY